MPMVMRERGRQLEREKRLWGVCVGEAAVGVLVGPMGARQREVAWSVCMGVDAVGEPDCPNSGREYYVM